MTDASKKKEDAKKNIRSVLQSAKGGLTLHELRRDYNDFFFSELPGKEFGYHSPEDFLKDIPDVVEIFYCGGTLTFKAVASASTAHIQRLVGLNKTSKKKSTTFRSRNVPFRSNSIPPTSSWTSVPPKSSWTSAPQKGPLMSAPPRFQKFYQNHSYSNGSDRPHQGPFPNRQNYQGQNYSAQSHSNRPHYMNQGYPSRPASSRNQARHRTVATVPAFIQSQIHELLDSNPHGLPLTHFCRIFKVRFKASIDPKEMGFRDEQEMLSSVPAIAKIKQFPQGEIRVISAEPSQQFPPKSETSKSPDQSRGALNDSGVGAADSDIEVSRKPSSDFQETWNDLFKNHNCNIPAPVQRKMKKLIEEKPDGIYASSLVSFYKDIFSEMLQIKTYGYTSVIDFVSDLSHIINIERPNPQGDWLLFPVNAKSRVEAVKEKQKETACTFLPVEDSVKESICQVLGAHPSGILLSQFLDTFREMTGAELEVKQYGKGTLKQFLHSLSDILNIVLDASDNLKVCSKYQQGPRRFDKLLDNYRPTTVSQESPEENLDLPADVVTPGCYYKPLSLPPMKDGEENYIELYVAFVINPSCFWIQLRGERTTLALEELMDDLEKHYKDKPSKKYHMPPVLAKEGTLCAALYPEDSYWYRAIILGYQSPVYKVYYVDYGNTCTVTIDNIRLLKRRFMKLPAQAFKARLSNIQPVAQRWTIRARDRMLEMCREIPLIGLISGIKDRTLSLCLTDTRGRDDIHINDMLVMEKYAKFVPDHDGQEEAPAHNQAPSSQMLFGDVRSSDSDGNTSGGPVRRYVRQAQINDDLILNLINLNGKGLYLISAEISSLFFKEDIISSMLMKDNAKIQKVVVAKNNYPDLFNEMIQYDTPWVTESTNRLGLYPLAGLPLITDLYGKGQDLDDLKDTVLEILDWFDPDDPYWKGEDDMTTESDETEQQQDSQSVTSDSSEPITLDDLIQALNILQMKRKQVLRKIMNNEGNVEELVNELNSYELSIKRVEERKAKQEMQESADKTKACDDKSPTSKTSDDNIATRTGMSRASSSLSALSSASTSAPKGPPTTTLAATATTTTTNSIPVPSNLSAGGLTALQQHNLFLNSLYMSSLGMMPNLSQSALHGLSSGTLNENVPNSNQLPGNLLQRQFAQSLLANQNLSSLMPGAGRSFAVPQFPNSVPSTLNPSQVTALNQAMLSSTPQIYNSQLLAMQGSLMPQLPDSAKFDSSGMFRPQLTASTSSVSGLSGQGQAGNQSLLRPNLGNEMKKS